MHPSTPQLLASLDTVEEEANIIQMGKLAVEEENRTLRDQNFEVQSRARAADAQLKKVYMYVVIDPSIHEAHTQRTN